MHRTPPGAAVSTLHADVLVVFMTKEVEAALLSATIASRRSHCLGFERAV